MKVTLLLCPQVLVQHFGQRIHSIYLLGQERREGGRKRREKGVHLRVLTLMIIMTMRLTFIEHL